MTKPPLSIEQLHSQIKWDDNGLVPAIIQDASSREVLMMAYMNAISLQKTLETGGTWFWSRSRQELWHKGASSGHIQTIKSMFYDCDGDTLLIQVEQTGPACHTGSASCFFNMVDGAWSAYRTGVEGNKGAGGAIPVETAGTAGGSAGTAGDPGSVGRFDILARLEATIAQRYAERPEGAYTTYLFEKGVDKILKKVGEETAEVIIAAKNQDHDELRYEASDLIFHLMVLLQNSKLPLDDVMKELERRHHSK